MAQALLGCEYAGQNGAVAAAGVGANCPTSKCFSAGESPRGVLAGGCPSRRSDSLVSSTGGGGDSDNSTYAYRCRSDPLLSCSEEGFGAPFGAPSDADGAALLPLATRPASPPAARAPQELQRANGSLDDSVPSGMVASVLPPPPRTPPAMVPAAARASRSFGHSSSDFDDAQVRIVVPGCEVLYVNSMLSDLASRPRASVHKAWEHRFSYPMPDSTAMWHAVPAHAVLRWPAFLPLQSSGLEVAFMCSGELFSHRQWPLPCDCRHWCSTWPGTNSGATVRPPVATAMTTACVAPPRLAARYRTCRTPVATFMGWHRGGTKSMGRCFKRNVEHAAAPCMPGQCTLAAGLCTPLSF